MREQLADLVRQTAPLFKKIKVFGDATGTRIEAMDEEKILYLNATINVVPEFVGEFGIGSLGLLSSLLNFASYKTDDATLSVQRSGINNHIAAFEFRDQRQGCTRFVTMNPNLVANAPVPPLKWNISVTPSKALIAELAQLAGMLLSEVDSFGMRIENKTLFLTLGESGGSTHTSSVAFASDIADVRTVPTSTWSIKHLLAVLKNAGTKPCTVQVADKGIVRVTVETDHGVYNYYLRAKL